VKIPDIPVVRLILRRRDKRVKASGTAIVDTGFDGGVYPNLQLLGFFEGLKPLGAEKLGTSLEEMVNCEVYRVEGALISTDGGIEIGLGEVNVYIPVDPTYMGEEVLIGREILNQLKIRLDGFYTELSLPI
jgi:hypothetical protein